MRSALLVCVTIMSTLAVTPGTAEASAANCATFEYVAHRGWHPAGVDENSLESFRRAVEARYSIETDVRADADGVLWFFHDRKTLRATGTDALIDQLTTQEVEQLRYKKAHSPLLKVRDGIDYLAGHPEARVYIEVKIRDWLPAVADIVRESGRVATTYFSAHTDYARTVAPEFPTQLKAFGQPLPTPANLVSRGVDVVMLNPKSLDAQTVVDYQAAGIEVQDRNANSTSEWRNTISQGADGQLTDFPDQVEAFCPSATEPPTIRDFSPVEIPAPGATVQIAGAHYYDVSDVRFGGVPAENFTTESPTSISATLPAGAPAQGLVSVTTPSGTGQSGTEYSVPVPRIASITPRQQVVGGELVIEGVNFEGVQSVSFGDTPSAHFTVESPTRIVVEIPIEARARGSVHVTTAAGVATSGDFYRISPEITTFFPQSIAPGDTVTIEGRSLLETTRVKFGVTDAAGFSVVDDRTVTAVVPTGVQTNGRVTVGTPGGATQSSELFQRSEPPSPESHTSEPGPWVGSLSPRQQPVGGWITVSGTNFVGVESVTFSGTPAAEVVVESPERLLVKVPLAERARGRVSVTTADGRASSANLYRIPPEIHTFGPTDLVPGDNVTIHGRMLGPVTRVKFGGVLTDEFTVLEDSRIVAVVPPSVPSTARILVGSPGGTARSLDLFHRRL